MFDIVLKDFGDGGAFPEIHVAQFPLEMGRKKRTSNALAVQVDAEGKIKYDAIARQGQSKDKVPHLLVMLNCSYFQWLKAEEDMMSYFFFFFWNRSYSVNTQTCFLRKC